MKVWHWLFVTVLVCSLSMFLLAACDDDDDDDDGDDDVADDDVADDDVADDDVADDDAAGDCTVEQICAEIIENAPDQWGYEDLDDCVELYLVGCNDTDQFMDCACNCLETSDIWEDFEACEIACWDQFCV